MDLFTLPARHGRAKRRREQLASQTDAEDGFVRLERLLKEPKCLLQERIAVLIGHAYWPAHDNEAIGPVHGTGHWVVLEGTDVLD